MVASADVRVGASDRLFPVAITSFARWFSAGSWFLTRASPAAEPPVVLRERRVTIAPATGVGRDHVCDRPMLSRRRVAACRETINDVQSTADRAMVGGRGHGHCAAVIVTAP